MTGISLLCRFNELSLFDNLIDNREDTRGGYWNQAHEERETVPRTMRPRDRSSGTISRIDTVYSLLCSFISSFRGVSSKRLGTYLDWFRWCRTFMATDFRTTESTVPKQLANDIW